MLIALDCDITWRRGKNVRKQVVSTDAKVNSSLQLLQVGTSADDSVHDEHSYGHAAPNTGKHTNQALAN